MQKHALILVWRSLLVYVYTPVPRISWRECIMLHCQPQATGAPPTTCSCGQYLRICGHFVVAWLVFQNQPTSVVGQIWPAVVGLLPCLPPFINTTIKSPS